MKKLKYFLAATAVIGALTLNASGKVTLLGVEYQVDTVSHLKVGPGTTTTHLRLTGPSLMQAHYLTIDKTAPGVSFHAVCGTDKVAGCERTSNMAKRKSTPQRLYYAGANADFFVTAGNASNGSSMVGTPISSCTADGEIYCTSAAQTQFAIDTEGVARIGTLDYSNGTATIGDKVTLYKGVNVDSPANGITLYTSRYYGSTNQNDKAGSCAEVVARLVEGDEFLSTGTYRLEILSEPTSGGDTAIPDGQFVIHGRGTSTAGCNTGALDFVNGLKPGDVVTLENVITFGGQRIYPTQIVSGNPKIVGNGVTLDYPDPALHPRTGIGTSQDGNTIVIMVVEGRYTGSAGIRIDALGDLMRYAGVYEGVNLDGGGSSTLYTSAFGIRNFCSDGYERAVSNGIFASVDLPEEVDNSITEVRFAYWHVRLPQYGRYTPRLIGYNRYGLVVNDSITDYTLSCPAELGEIRDYYMLATGSGTHALTAEVNGIKVSVPVTVDDNVQFATRISDLLIDDIREYTVELIANDGVKTLNVAPEALSWSSSDAAVATVDEYGVIKGVADGNAVITGKVSDKEVSLNVTVEVAKTHAINILENFDATKWKFSKSGCSSTTAVSVAGTGIEIPYTVTSSRSASLTLTPNPQVQFWSLPDDLELTLEAQGAPVTATTVKLITANGVRLSASLPEIAEGDRITGKVNLSELANTDDLLIYPIKLMSLTFTLQPKSGNEGKVVFPEFNSVYSVEGGIGEIRDDIDTAADGEEEYYNLQGIRVQNPSGGLYIRKWGNKAEKIIIR